MAKSVKIIDPIVKKSDAIHAVGGPKGKEAQLAEFLGISRQSVRDWNEYLPVLQAHRMSRVFPWLEIEPEEAA